MLSKLKLQKLHSWENTVCILNFLLYWEENTLRATMLMENSDKYSSALYVKWWTVLFSFKVVVRVSDHEGGCGEETRGTCCIYQWKGRQASNWLTGWGWHSAPTHLPATVELCVHVCVLEERMWVGSVKRLNVVPDLLRPWQLRACMSAHQTWLRVTKVVRMTATKYLT